MTWQHTPEFESVHWHFDPAADCFGRPWPRRRAFVESVTGEPAELVAYEDGGWGLGLPHRQYQYVAMGSESDLAAAQQRVFRVWQAMTT